ncbi:MAG: hypothetical protein J0M12_12040 [Deltaproteobacteria bacterium]|nr:hypothetical protein [Deltaproteobacteria bacterium]
MRLFSTFIPILSLAVLIPLASISLRELGARAPQILVDESQGREALYLPSGKGLQALSFGYRNVLSNILWFNTINYFGKHHRGDQKYVWLAHMCGLVTDLNPRAAHVYDFCGNMLSWEAGKPQEAVNILTKAIAQFPTEWMLYYQRGFTYLFFLKEPDKAQADFITASGLPEAHVLVKRLAAKRLAASESAQAAIDFLTDMLQGQKDPTERAALESRLQDAYYERGFQMLERARDLFKEQTGTSPSSLSELSEKGLVRPDFKDPFGGHYVLDPQTGEISSTSGHKRISSKP